MSREDAAIAIHEFAVITMSSQSHEAVETTEERRHRLRAEKNAEKAKGTKAFAKVVADREGITVRRLHEIIAEETKPVLSEWGG